jgi:glycosyltransferase involved in cell wall biosynthesis
VRRKVCHVVATTEGAPWMFEQLRELRDQYGFEVTAVVSGDHGKLIDQLDSEGIPHFVANFDFTTVRGMLRLPGSVFRLAQLFRQQRFDVVQTHIFLSMLVGRLAAWLADVPVRLSMIAGPFHLEAHTSRWIDRSTCWMETMLIPSCEESMRLCRKMGVPEKRLALVYYGPDEQNFNPRKTSPANIRQFFGWPPDTPLVGMIAYFYPRLSKGRWIPPYLHERGIKGHEDLINAATTILEEFPTTKFLLVGSGWGDAGESYRNELKEQVANLGLEDSIIFTGYHSNVKSILCEVNIAVQASLNENLGGTLEALLMECPLVATRVGGMVDAVLHGETGILVNPSSPNDLAEGIMKLLREPEVARTLGASGRKLMLKRFTLDRTVKDLAELYGRLIVQGEKRRTFHSPLVSLWRASIGVPVLFYLAGRLIFADIFLPTYLPIYLARVRAVPRLIYYRVRAYAHYLRIYAYYVPRGLLRFALRAMGRKAKRAKTKFARSGDG